MHAEYGRTGAQVVSLLACSLVGKEIGVSLEPESLLARLYEKTSVVEQTTCSYGLDPAMQHIAGEKGMRIVGTDETGEVRAIERDDHPFFVATLYQPQLSSTPERPHPVFLGLIEAAARC